MTNRAEALYRLQTIDLAMDKVSRRLQEVEAEMRPSEALQEERRSLQKEEQALAELRSKLRRLDLDLKGLESKIASTEEQLYSGQVRSPKELAGMEQESRYLKRSKGELEDEMLETMINIEEREDSVAAKREGLKAIETEWERRQAQLRKEQADLQVELADLRERRGGLRGSIADEDLAIYEELRRKKGGRSVALLKGGICQGCGVALPTSLAQRARHSPDLNFCVICGRILYAEG